MSTVAPASPAAPAFEYFTGTYNTIVVPAGTPADPTSGYDQDGTIRIVEIVGLDRKGRHNRRVKYGIVT